MQARDKFKSWLETLTHWTIASDPDHKTPVKIEVFLSFFACWWMPSSEDSCKPNSKTRIGRKQGREQFWYQRKQKEQMTGKKPQWPCGDEYQYVEGLGTTMEPGRFWHLLHGGLDSSRHPSCMFVPAFPGVEGGGGGSAPCAKSLFTSPPAWQWKQYQSWRSKGSMSSVGRR